MPESNKTRSSGAVPALLALGLVSLVSVLFTMEATLPPALFENRVEPANWGILAVWTGSLLWLDRCLLRTESRRLLWAAFGYWIACLLLIVGSVLAGQLSPTGWWFFRLTPLIHWLPLWNPDRTWDWPWNAVQWGMLAMIAGHAGFCLWLGKRARKGTEEPHE